MEHPPIISEGRESILLVEDNSNDVMLILRAVKQSNIPNPVKVVVNGEEAISYLSGEGKYADREQYPLPILMLLDLKLPRKSGHEVLAWVRSQDLLKRLPVVILTSSQRSSDINQSFDLGANSYLVKPASFQDLIDLMKTLNIYWIVINEKPELTDMRENG